MKQSESVMIQMSCESFTNDAPSRPSGFFLTGLIYAATCNPVHGGNIKKDRKRAYSKMPNSPFACVYSAASRSDFAKICANYFVCF